MTLKRSEIKGDITSDNIEMRRIVRDYYKQRNVNKLDALKEMINSYRKKNLRRLNCVETENLNKSITNMETKTFFKTPKKERPRS